VTFREEAPTALRDQFLVDVEEIVFRYAERAATDPALGARLQRIARIARTAAVIETRVVGTDRLARHLSEARRHWERFRTARRALAESDDPREADRSTSPTP
jgi:hypothetical protein